MKVKTMFPMLLLFAIAGCPRSGDGPDPGAPGTDGASPTAEAAASTPMSTPARAPEAQALPDAQPQAASTAGSPDAPRADPSAARAGAGAGGAQGIRVGEPAPDDPRGPHRPAPGTAWHAFGNEPFWSVQARGGTLVFTTPEDQKGVTLLGRRVPSLIGTVILGSGPKGEFHFGVTPGKCSDGMSDRSHGYTSTFIYDGVTYKGCAEPVEAR